MAKVSYTTATLAAEVATTPKELRKFLRSDASGIESVGKGGRYNIELTATQLAKLKKNHTAWVAAQDEAKKERQAAALAAAIIAAPTADDAPGAVTEADLEEFDAEYEPTEADLLAGDGEITDEELEELADEA